MNYSNSNSNNLRISNEHLHLINILNTMYNDNTRNINSIIETLNILINNNNQIRNVIVQILGSNQNGSNNNNNTRRYTSRRWETNNYNRIASVNRPSYIIDSISEYLIPMNNFNNSNNNNNRNRRPINNEMLSQVLQSFLQPVEIYPTQDQIDTATRRVRYCDIVRPINTSCPISMEDFHDEDNVIIIRNCGHIFHTESLMNWFRTNCRCPVCRYDIRDYNLNASTQFFNNQTNIDISNNNIDRNTNDNNLNNFRFDVNTLYNNVNNLNNLNNNDLSGNYTYSQSDILSSILSNGFNRV